MDFFNRYQFDRAKDRIGKGGFGEVYRAYDTLLHQNVALKFYPREEGQDKYGVIDEMKTAIRLNHPNIVRVFDANIVEITDNYGKKHIYEVGIMELVEGGSLREFIDAKPNLNQIHEVVVGMMRGLEYLHSHSIIHRDLKPANILIKHEHGKIVPKIVDFGISKQTSNELTTRTGIIGTYEYIAPEMLDVDAYGVNGKITTNVDLWSFGVMLYELFTGGDLPFGSRRFGMTEGQIIAKILGNANLSKLETIPLPYRTIIERCLIRNAAHRTSTMSDLLRLFDQSYSSKPQPQHEQHTQVQPQNQHSQPHPQAQPHPRNQASPPPQNYRPQNVAHTGIPPKASLGSRFVASLIDGMIGLGIFVITLLVMSGDIEDPDELTSLTCVTTSYIYFLFKDGLDGGSIGKRMMGLTVLHQASHTPISYGRSFLRNCVNAIPGVNIFTGFIDIIMVFADNQGKRIGDHMSNTMVVEKKFL